MQSERCFDVALTVRAQYAFDYVTWKRLLPAIEGVHGHADALLRHDLIHQRIILRCPPKAHPTSKTCPGMSPGVTFTHSEQLSRDLTCKNLLPAKETFMAMRMPSLSLIFSIRAMYCSTRGATLPLRSVSAVCAASHVAEGMTPSSLHNHQDGVIA